MHLRRAAARRLRLLLIKCEAQVLEARYSAGVSITLERLSLSLSLSLSHAGFPQVYYANFRHICTHVYHVDLFAVWYCARCVIATPCREFSFLVLMMGVKGMPSGCIIYRAHYHEEGDTARRQVRESDLRNEGHMCKMIMAWGKLMCSSIINDMEKFMCRLLRSVFARDIYPY